jgi:Helix-turn-helix domain
VFSASLRGWMMKERIFDLITNASNPAKGSRSTLKSTSALDALLAVARGQSKDTGGASPMPEGLRPLLVSPQQARLLLGVSMATLYNLMNAGALESCRIGGSRKITLSSIEKFVAEKMAKGRCPPATGR